MSVRDRTTLLKPSRLGSIAIDIWKVHAMKQTWEGKNKNAQWTSFLWSYKCNKQFCHLAVSIHWTSEGVSLQPNDKFYLLVGKEACMLSYNKGRGAGPHMNAELPTGLIPIKPVAKGFIRV
jgi:hypothetical protein